MTAFYVYCQIKFYKLDVFFLVNNTTVFTTGCVKDIPMYIINCILANYTNTYHLQETPCVIAFSVDDFAKDITLCCLCDKY